jgi:hypothetical protein
MSKNLTRKGAAFGALVALSISAVAPASAAGLADTSFVSLAPTSGSAYAVVADAGKTFSLTSNEASLVVGGDLKFLVSDASDTLVSAVTSSGRAITVADNSATLITIGAGATDTIRITDATLAAQLSTGDRIVFDADLVGDGNSSITGLASDATAFEVTVSGNDVTFTTDLSLNTEADLSGAINGAVTGKVISEARDTTAHNFVVDTGSHTAASNSTLVLAAASTTTRTVEVTAWVDSNDNDAIDSTEYVSPTRSVTFKKASEITGSLLWTAPALGDTSLVAKVATTPELNGSQMSAEDISVKFTRQGSTTTGLAASETTTPSTGSTVWNSTDKVWVATAYTGQSAANTPWAGLADSAATDVVFAGTYTARPYIGATAIAAASAIEVSSTQADDVKSTIAATADNLAAKNETAGSATAVVVRTGKSLTVTAKIYDNATTPALVGAGIPVTATLSSTTGTIKVNSVSTSDQELTDANGVVTFVVSSTSAAATDAATLTIQAQNVTDSAKKAAYTITWDDATAALFDSAVANPYSDLNRSVVLGGTNTFKFQVTDQFAQAISGSYRLKVENTGNTVSTAYHSLVNGAATVAVTDGSIDAGSSITTTVTVQKDVDGTWTSQDLTNDGNSDGSADTVAYTIGLLTQTDKVTLDADGSSTYGSGTADDVDDLAAAMTVAIDSRSSNVTVPTYTNDVVISGRVAHATTAAARPGAVVTVSGDAAFLFQSGGVYSFGSITLVADSSGEFDVNVYSNKAATDSVITVTSNGASATRKVTFNAAAETAGASLTPSVATVVAPGSYIAYKVVLKDIYGNVVDTSTSGRLELTATGAGYFQSTPASVTDSKGELSAVWVTPTAGYSDVVFTIKYSDADSDFTDTTDLTVVSTVAVNNSVAEAEAAAKAAAEAAAALAAKAKTVTATASATTSQTGRAVDVTVKALNTAGAAAAGRTVTFTSTGAGSLTAYTAVTDANGVANVKVLAGAADNGDAVVVASVDGVSATASTITFGTTDAQIDIVGNRVTAVASFSKGKTVAFYVDGIKKWSKLSISDSDVVLFYNLKKGTHTVTIKISGGFVTTERFIVK